MAKKKKEIECSSCSENYAITFNNRTGVIQFCPFCGEEIDVSERSALIKNDNYNFTDDLDDEYDFEDSLEKKNE